MGFRYIGNKTRLAPTLIGAIAAETPAPCRVADPMCGTATVSRQLAASGYTVVAGDALTFPVLHAEASLLHAAAPAFAQVGGYQCAIATLNSLPTRPGFFHREYSAEGRPTNGSAPRAYLTGANAGLLDAMRAQIQTWDRTESISPGEKRLLLHDVIMAVNVVANIAGTYGYFRSKWNPASLQRLNLRPSDFADWAGQQHQVYQGAAEDTVGGLEVEVLYLDPPYTKRQYAGNYHLLETIAAEDEPEPAGMGGLRPWHHQYSAFCSKRRARDALIAVMETQAAHHVFLSYSEDGLIPEHDVFDTLCAFGRVRRHEFPIGRFRSNGGRTGPVVEHLYHVEIT